MNQDQVPKLLRLNPSGLGCWLTFILSFLLLGSVGFGWLAKGLLIVLGLILITPAIALFGFRWWLQRSLVQSQCPVCNHEFPALKTTSIQCPNCGEALQVEQGNFTRLTPPGTIDVEAVEVPAQSVDE